MPTLYHYCSNEVFKSILEAREIRLSALSLSNDTMEGRLAADILRHLAVEDGLDEGRISRIQNSFESIEHVLEGLGFCLSEEGDLLSQWRGYATGGAGVSVGFNPEYLEALGKKIGSSALQTFSLKQVLYGKEEQIELVAPTYSQVKKLIDDGAYAPPQLRTLLDTRTDEEVERDTKEQNKKDYTAAMTIFTLFDELFRLKSPAFSEEREWRLITHFIKSGDDECMFHASENKICPYKPFRLEDLDTAPILEIVLGPKNITPPFVIQKLLEMNGFEGVKVRPSEATYR